MAENRARIRVVNPNSNEAVTRGLDEALDPLRFAGGPEIVCSTLAEGPFGIETQADVERVTLPLRRRALPCSYYWARLQQARSYCFPLTITSYASSKARRLLPLFRESEFRLTRRIAVKDIQRYAVRRQRVRESIGLDRRL